jgi:nucleoside 2-deoxyribosyltransferase
MATHAKIYVGCSLTKAPEDFKAQVEAFKDTLRGEGYEVFDFVGLVNGTPASVYNWDIGHCVRDCDIFVAICDEPSIGLGYELCEALRLGKPVLAVAHADAKVTRLVLGAAEVEEKLRFERYEQLIDVLPLINGLAGRVEPTAK